MKVSVRDRIMHTTSDDSVQNTLLESRTVFLRQEFY